MKPTATAMALAVENAKYGDEFVEVATLPRGGSARALRAWRNRHFLVALYLDGDHERLSINRTTLAPTGGRWADGITWDELMRCKRAVGYGDRWCVECYPPEAAVVNVANMRHLFVLPEAPAYGWTS